MPQSQTSTPVCKQCKLICIRDENNKWFCPGCRGPVEHEQEQDAAEAEVALQQRQRGG